MSYHHDSRRIFIGQDNGAVVVSELTWKKKKEPHIVLLVIDQINNKSSCYMYGLENNIILYSILGVSHI